MSNLSGMTGFARETGEAEWGNWAWEAKSVNGRGLDVRINTPPGFDALERTLKASAGKMFKRGSLQISLRIEMTAREGDVTVNTELLQTLTQAAQAEHGTGLSGEAIATLMTVKGVVEAGSQSLRDLGTDKEVVSILEAGGQNALKGLAAARHDEGQTLEAILSDALTQLGTITKSCASFAGQQPELLKARLEKQLAELGATESVDADRQAAEIALAAAKADVQEELDRLIAHIETGRGLLAEGSPVGRKLDFLAQELNREANTLCSKSISLDLTNAGLGLKGVIDQFKEQSANVE